MNNSSKNPDIIFVVSHANTDSMYMPFYYLYLAGYLEKHGFTVEIFNHHEATAEKYFKMVVDEVIKKQPRFIGLATFVTDYASVVALATEIKKHTDTPILVGNAHPSIAPEDFLYEGSPFDIVVRGEGELTVRQILEEYKKDSDMINIWGIAYFKDGAVTITRSRELMDMSECGMPAYHKIDLSWYQRPVKFIIRRLVTVGAVIYTGRGCPYDCSFCASNSVWKANERTAGKPLVRKRPIAHIIEDLRILENVYGFDFFYILDDTFGIKEDDITSFCNAYRESGLTMLWAAETRVNCIRNEHVLKLLKESGCIQLDFGVETGSPRLLKDIHKVTTVEQTIRAFDLCKRSGIRTFANILLNLPGEDEEDLQLTHRLLETIRPTFTSVGVTQPYPGTDTYKRLGKAIRKEDYANLNRLFPPEDYRLSKHKLNLERLLFSWFRKYGIVAPIEKSLFKADRQYWMKILRSKKRWKYLFFLIKDICVTFVHYIAFFRYYLKPQRNYQ